ncbi:uncharacterized protein LOC119996971 [Tripterygium wilfordii]|uniref:uncharacterized protein LOC119996971 n=1 Tax=Tripterygium wilfordii TaxID=458696 RepID=UPI0018F8495D|nr:uncharacterized protein LOC119996971 [Tripterygium wilfordii]
MDVYSEQYLRSPNERELIRLLDENKSRGFPRIIGSLDCMHWEWKNRHTAWHDHSPLFDKFIQCQTPNIPYKVNGRMYDIPYYLTNCTYPYYATLVQTLKHPLNEMEKHFAKKQEAARKDVKRAFSMLQAKWAITRGPIQFWDEETITNIMNCCIILHNMIIEDEQRLNIDPWQPVLDGVLSVGLLKHDEGLLGCFISSRM